MVFLAVNASHGLYRTGRTVGQRRRAGLPLTFMAATKREKPVHSLLAGATAGAIEAFCTYPAEYVKTRSQFGGKARRGQAEGRHAPNSRPQREGPIAIIRSTLREKGVTGLYSGCTALVVGNALKAGVRFVSYDYFKTLLADKNVRVASYRVSLTEPSPQGKVSAPRSLVGECHLDVPFSN